MHCCFFRSRKMFNIMYGTAAIKQEPVDDYNGNAPQAGGLLTKIKEEPGLSTPVEASQPRIKQESDPGFGQTGAVGSTARYLCNCNLPSIFFYQCWVFVTFCCACRSVDPYL